MRNHRASADLPFGHRKNQNGIGADRRPTVMADQPRRQQQQQQQQQQQEQRQEVRKTLTNDAERTKSPIPKSRGKLRAFKERATEKKPPPGGFDDTPVPIARPGLTVRITFHCARNLPTADINSLSSDPFIVAQLNTSLPTRHKEDPPLVFRTPTIHRTQNPEWNAQWVVANVPTSGFQMKIRIYDEDPADHDDRLGNAHLVVGTISANRPGLRLHDLKIEKRMESKRAWIVTGCLALAKFQIHLDMRLTVSVEVLGATEGQGGKVYTIGPQYWSTHFSPMIGRLTGTKVPGEKGKAQRYKSVISPPASIIIIIISLVSLMKTAVSRRTRFSCVALFRTRSITVTSSLNRSSKGPLPRLG